MKPPQPATAPPSGDAAPKAGFRPSRTTSAPPPTPPPPATITKSEEGLLVQGLGAIYDTAATVAVALGREDVATSIELATPVCVQRWVDAARVQPAVLRTLRRLLGGGVWASLAVAHLPIILPFLPPNIIAAFMRGTTSDPTPSTS